MITQSFISLVSEVCCEKNCGVTFALEEGYRNQKLKDHTNFYCPNGHGQHYTAKTAVEAERDRLKNQLQLTENCLANTRQSLTHMGERARSAERSVQARKGVITRMKRRLVAGRCVCCSRQFKDLEKHMQAEHPKWNPEKGAEAIAQRKAGS